MPPIQEFNLQRSLYQVLYSFVNAHLKQFEGVKTENLSKAFFRSLIEEKRVVVNGIILAQPTYKVRPNDVIEVSDTTIKFTCALNLNLDDSQENLSPGLSHKVQPKTEEHSSIEDSADESKFDSSLQYVEIVEKDIDTFVVDFFQNELLCEVNESALNKVDSKKVVAYLVQLFQLKSFSQLKESRYSYEMTNFLQKKIRTLGLVESLNLSKHQVNSTGSLIETLIVRKQEEEQRLSNLIEDLKRGLFDENLFRFIQEYSKATAKQSFQYLVTPLLNLQLSSKATLEQLCRMVQNAKKITDQIEKFKHFDTSKDPFSVYLLQCREDSNTYNRYYLELGEYLFSLLRKVCEAPDEKKSASLALHAVKKKYNFNSANREIYDLYLTISNPGEGLAKKVKLASASENFEFISHDQVDLLYPGQQREITVRSKVKVIEGRESKLKIKVMYEDLTSNSITKHFFVTLSHQDKNIPWEELSRLNPYSIQVIEEKSRLYGRDEIIRELKNNALSNNIESYKIWGQKRVGKSSIVKTLKSLLDSDPNLLVVYRSLGGLRNADPVRTLNDLGESLYNEILDELSKKDIDTEVSEKIQQIELPFFAGSLNPLETYIKKLHRICPKLKLIFILDEFDRINEEFFLPSNLGETLSLGIGKGLNEYNYIAFFLVGSENMHLLDRQGINYNSYREKEVDTFNKEKDFNSYKNIIVGPTAPHLNFSEETIYLIYDTTNGNPYFTNLICYNCFKNAYKNEDLEIDRHAVEQSINEIVNSSQKSHFEHFWGDGLAEDSLPKKEKKIDIRRRILVSYSISYYKLGLSFPGRQDILKNFKYPEEYKIEPYEVDNTITEFFNRKIFFENKTLNIRIRPLLFEAWLCGPGRTLMIEGVSDLEAMHRENQLQVELILRQDEIKFLSEKFRYQGQKKSPQFLTKYFSQFGDHSNQRKVFKLIANLVYISQEELNDFFRKNQKSIFQKREIKIPFHSHIAKREKVELYCFSKRYDESRAITESFKTVCNIRSTKLIKNLKLEGDSWKRSGAEEVVILHPIADQIGDFEVELLKFLNGEIKGTGITVKLVIIVTTPRAKNQLRKRTSACRNLQLFVCKEVEEDQLRPFQGSPEIFESKEEQNQTYALVKKYYSGISAEALAVLFEPLCPTQAIDILWKQSSEFNPVFANSLIELDQAVTSEIHTYNVALSFAGEERPYVEQVAAELTRLGVKIFYDEYEQVDLWGKDLFQHLSEVYKEKSEYCLAFISKSYESKNWPRHEIRNAQARAFKSSREYILPVLMDDASIPGLSETVGYVDGRKTTPKDLAQMTLQKIRLGQQHSTKIGK